jgi:short-subunit dehydrogenase
MDPKGRHILVTGASSGIGRAVSLQLAARGARLTIAARREAELARTAAECRGAGAACEYVVADVSRRDECLRLAAEAERRLGPIDALVNNAGFAIFDAIADAATGDVERMMATNFFGTLWCTQAVLPSMLERRSGAIVNVGSIAGLMGYARMGGYCASKFAVTGMTEALRAEVADRGVAVSLVAPATTDTEFFVTAEKGKMPGASRMILAIPPERVARAIVRAIESGRRRAILPFPAALFMRFKEILPGPAHFLMAKVSRRMERNRR